MIEEFSNKKAREIFIKSLRIANDSIVREEEERKVGNVSEETLQMRKDARQLREVARNIEAGLISEDEIEW